jgi:hypothetical protein
MGELVFSGDIDRDRINQLLPLLFLSIGLSGRSEQEPNLPVIDEASIYVRGLKISEGGTDYTSTTVIANLAIQGLKIDADGQITMREVFADGVDSTTLQSMFYNAPDTITSQVLIPVFRARGVQADGFNKVGGANFRRWPLRFTAETVDASNSSYLERPLRRSSSAPQRESRFTLKKMRIERLGRDALGFVKASGFQLQSTDLPNITLNQMSLSSANWRSGSYLLSQLAMRTSYIGRNLPEPPETMSQLWPAGPFDIGLSGMDIQGLSVKYDGVIGVLDRFALWTQKSSGGLVGRFYIPRGSLKVQVEEEPNDRPGNPMSGLVGRVLALLKLDQLNLSWEVRGHYDGQRDMTIIDRLKIKLDKVAEFDLSATLGGVENARNKLNAYDTFGRAWTIITGRRPSSSTWSADRQDARQVGALTTNNIPQSSAKDGEKKAIVGAIRVNSFTASLTDLGGVDRFSNAYVAARSVRRSALEIDQQAARCYFATRTLESEQSRPASPFTPYPTVLEGVVRWIEIGGKLKLTQMRPAQLKDFGSQSVRQQPSLSVRNVGRMPTRDCRR